jgi:hypothetical protein
VILDLEDACAPLAKPGARRNIVAALNEGGCGEKNRTVRVHDWTTEWTVTDVTRSLVSPPRPTPRTRTVLRDVTDDPWVPSCQTAGLGRSTGKARGGWSRW